MKSLKLEPIKIGEMEAHEVALLKSCVNNVDQKSGIVAEELQKRLRILTALKECSERSFGKKPDELKEESLEISLEDADAETLKPLAKNMIWAVVDESIVTFCNKVAEM